MQFQIHNAQFQAGPSAGLHRQARSAAPRLAAQLRPRRLTNAASGAVPSDPASSSSSAGSTSDGLERIVFLNNGDAVILSSRTRKELYPSLHFSREEAVAKQLEALQNNNEPYPDHGVEVLYRFANFDPFNPRCFYFGRSFDLGQFERFRRIMHTTPYAVLLNHESSTVLSSLEASEHLWHTRVLVQGPARSDGSRDEGIFVFTLSQRVGGIYDGYWFCDSLVADGNTWEWMRSSASPGRLI